MYKNNFCPKVAQKKFYLCIIIFGDKIPHNRYRLLAYRPTHTTYPIIPIERHKFSKRLVFHVAWRCFAIAQHDRHVSFRARPVGRRGVSMSSRTHVRDLIQNRLGGDASLSLSMTDTWQEILPPYGRQNDRHWQGILQSKAFQDDKGTRK